MTPGALRDVADRRFNGGIPLNARAGLRFRHPDGLPRLRGDELAEFLVHGHRDLDVGGMLEGAVVEDRVGQGFGAVDEDAAAGQGFEDDERDGFAARKGQFVDGGVGGLVVGQDGGLLSFVTLE